MVTRHNRARLGLAFAFCAVTLPVTAAGSPVTIPRGLTDATCSISLSAADQTVGIAGGFVSFIILTPTPDCAWSLSGIAPWVDLKSPASGSGSALVSLEVSRNSGPGRLSAIVVGTQTFLLRQVGPGEIRRTAGDFTGDGAGDMSLYRPSTGTWFVPGLPEFTLGGHLQIPVPADYDGDRATDAATYEPATGIWRFVDGSSVAWGKPADIPVPADYDGDGRADVAVFRPALGRWFVMNVGTFDWGRPGDIPVPADFDGDGRADIVVFRRATGTWWIRGTDPIVWGRGGDLPVAADYDGDGRADIAVYRPGTGQWFVRDQFTEWYGRPGDWPMPLDYDGDGRADLAVYRLVSGLWFINGRGAGLQVGQPGDVPPALAVKQLFIRSDDYDGVPGHDQALVESWSMPYPSVHRRYLWSFVSGVDPLYDDPGVFFGLADATYIERVADFDGDGRLDLVLFLPPSGGSYISLSSTGYSQLVQYGLLGSMTDTSVLGDYDGDGRADLMSFRSSEGRWYLRSSLSEFASAVSIDWGLAGDAAVPADYDGDGLWDLAVFRPSTGRWYVKRSSDQSMMTVDWGLSTDIPVPEDYDGDGRADVAIFRPSTGEWWVRYSSTDFTTYSTTVYGASGDVPLPGDFNADGRAEPAYWRTGLEHGLFVSGLGLLTTAGKPVLPR